MSFPHNTHTGALAGTCNLNSVVWPLSWDRVFVAFSKHTSTIGVWMKHHTKYQNFFHESPFGHANRAISMIPLSRRYETLRLYLACRTHGALEYTLCSGGWRGAERCLVEFDYGRRPQLSTRTTKKHIKYHSSHTKGW